MVANMCKEIVRAEDPACIMLVGSRAGDKGRPDSDVDLIVVTRQDFHEGRTRRQVTASIRRALSRFRVPKDILVYSPSEVERWRNSRNHIIYTGLKDGRILYERRQSRPVDAVDGA
jgi:uncharacterized protein